MIRKKIGEGIMSYIKHRADESLEDYLETYKSLYDDYTSSSSKRINKRLVSLIFIVSIFMALLSIPFLATHTALGFIGVL